MFEFEWLIIELVVLALLGAELYSVRRTIRRRQEKEAEGAATGDDSRPRADSRD